MAKSGERLRLKFFKLGQKAIQRIYPSLPDGYLCPLCLRLFKAEALAANVLTLEHIPPKKLAGKPLCLTCIECNHGAGETLDPSMKSGEDALDFALGTMKKPLIGKIEAEGAWESAEILADSDGIHIVGHPKSSPPYSPENLSEIFAEHAKDTHGNSPLSFSLTWTDKFQLRHQLIGWLRSAYLVAFAKFGYSYAMNPLLKEVRAQISNPNKNLLRTFSITSASESPSTRRLMIVKEPAELQSVGVQFGRHFVFLPWPTNPSLYSNIAPTPNVASQQINKSLKVDILAWPSGPEHFYDQAKRN